MKRKLFESLQLNANDIWYHGCSKSEILTKLHPPSCKHPLFLAKNPIYAAEYSKLVFDPSTGFTGGENVKPSNDQTSKYFYIITLDYSKCKAFNPKTDASKLDSFYHTNAFSKLCKICDYNVNSICWFPSSIFDAYYQCELENYIDDDIIDNDMSSDELMSMSDDDFLSIDKFMSLVKSGEFFKFVQKQYDKIDDRDFINPINANIDMTIDECLALIEFMQIFANLHSDWVPLKSNANTIHLMLEDIKAASSCNVILTNESMRLNALNQKSEITSDALIVVDISALGSIYPKRVTMADIK